MKNFRFKIRAKLTWSFTLILIILLVFFVLSFININIFSNSIKDFYEHPFLVSNTVREIDTNIIRIHRAMKDLSLSDNSADINNYLSQVNQLEAEVLSGFTLVYDHYLGDKKDVDDAYSTFIGWREIREEVINYMMDGEYGAAIAITRGRGARHVFLLEQQMQALILFASNKAESFYSDAMIRKESLFREILILFVLAVALGIGITTFTIRSITRPLLQIVHWIRELSVGKLDREISINRGDEIGDLADSCRLMQNNLIHKSEIARLIAEGDFSQKVEVHSDEDQVAFSINQIAENYSRINSENEVQNWQNKGLNIINQVMQGEQEIIHFSKNVVSALCKYFDYQIGAFYLADNKRRQLSLLSSYAFNLRKTTSNIIPFGDGLGGQCAVEQSIISISNLPDDFFRIGAGIGDCQPANVIAVPIMHEQELVAVIELGSIKEINALHLKLIEIVSGPIGISAHSVLAKEQTDFLLKETQKQSAELVQQQEELRQTNEELQAQTSALKDSEEKLQQQQEELRVSNEELEEKTEELIKQKDSLNVKNTQLDRAMIEIAEKAENLKQSSSYKSEFMANMSHELRTPLNSIIILSKLLSRNEAENLTGKQTEFAETIYSSGKDLLHLIDEILDLSKIEAGKMEIIRETTPIKKITDAMQANFNQLAEEKSLQFEISLEENLPNTLFIDKIRVEQILKNLLSNAFKFTSQGGVSLIVGRESENRISFSVKDTGIGIPEDKKDIIFEAFKQADGTTNRRFGGTGLGLSISLELALILGGELKMHSSVEEGSTFTLLLPIQPVESSKSIVKNNKERGTKVKNLPSKMISKSAVTILDDRDIIKPADKSIVIIEDDPVFAGIVLDLARKRGFKGLIAQDGETGLHYADYYVPSAIILDIGLPGISGWDVMERLKSNDTTRYIPVHFLTATDVSQEALREGAIGFLQKPAEPEMIEDVFSRIENIIDGKMKNLLLVENNEAERTGIKGLLDGKDLKITEVSTGKDAILQINKNSFDCIVLDLGLDDMSGFDILSELRNEVGSSIPVVVYTGRDLDESERIELQKYSESVIIKSARSPERLVEETALFLHRVESELPKEKQNEIKLVREKNTSLKGKKILLVDDDMRNVFALSSILEESGVQIIVGKNGKEGLEKLDSEPNIDLILMDIMMPVMDGYEAMETIRKNVKFTKLPIIALTAKAMKGDRNKCIASGASDYLVKPVEIDKLLSLLRVWLHG